MDAKHTPGPWVCGWGDGLTGPTTRAVGGATVAGPAWATVPVSRGRETIAICPNQRPEEFTQEQIEGSGEANARLIAAAPEMLEALKLAEEHFGGFEVDLSPNDPDFACLAAVRGAIAKAEGK